jgi:hypothetical protein
MSELVNSLRGLFSSHHFQPFFSLVFFRLRCPVRTHQKTPPPQKTRSSRSHPCATSNARAQTPSSLSPTQSRPPSSPPEPPSSALAPPSSYLLFLKQGGPRSSRASQQCGGQIRHGHISLRWAAPGEVDRGGGHRV